MAYRKTTKEEVLSGLKILSAAAVRQVPAQDLLLFIGGGDYQGIKALISSCGMRRITQWLWDKRGYIYEKKKLRFAGL